MELVAQWFRTQRIDRMNLLRENLDRGPSRGERQIASHIHLLEGFHRCEYSNWRQSSLESPSLDFQGRDLSRREH